MFNSVGLVGVGAMGQALLHRLILAGARVKAFDISEEAMAAARKLGAETVGSASEAARGVQAVHMFVRTDEEEMAAATGPNGVLEGAAPGTVLILHSTVMPETTRKVAAAAAKANVDVVDAPVTAVPRYVQAGEAVFLLGGEQDVVARVRPHLEALGPRTYHFGGLGTGNVAKIAKNLATAIERVAAAEIVWMAEAGGLDPTNFFEFMRAEHDRPVMQRWDSAFSIENGHAVPRPASNLLNKDVGLAAKYARASKVTARVTQGAADTAAEWVAEWEKEGRAR